MTTAWEARATRPTRSLIVTSATKTWANNRSSYSSSAGAINPPGSIRRRFLLAARHWSRHETASARFSPSPLRSGGEGRGEEAHRVHGEPHSMFDVPGFMGTLLLALDG